jgi:hypothetical protein
MIFRNRLKNPRAMVCAGMSFLVIGIVWPWVIHPTTQVWRDAAEGMRGMLFGISFAINLGTIWLAKVDGIAAQADSFGWGVWAKEFVPELVLRNGLGSAGN